MSGKEKYMLKSRKAELIAELTTAFADTTAVIICDYKGLTVVEYCCTKVGSDGTH